jgi:hypothetical protein
MERQIQAGREVTTMSNDNPHTKEHDNTIKPSPLLNWVVAILIVLLVLGYTIMLITGTIKSADKLDAVALALIALGALLFVALINPQVLQRIRILELGGLKVELREVRTEQAAQKDALEAITTILSILLPKDEQKHLDYLLRNKAAAYKGGNAMRTELRHLRTIGLIEMRRNHTIDEMHSNMTFDLTDYVKLTDLGTKSAELINEAKTAKADRAKEEENREGALALAAAPPPIQQP